MFQSDRRRSRAVAAAALAALLLAQARGATQPPPPAQTFSEAPAGWEGEWVERDFPFFSSVVDARGAGPQLPGDNLTPRGLVLNLGRDLWVAYDTDLLRVAAVWRGRGLTPAALAPGSYHDPSKKTPGGQSPLPAPDGRVWMANGIFAGWQAGPEPVFTDSRSPAPSPEEVGRGPIAEGKGRFDAIRLVQDGVVLEQHVGKATVREWFTASAGGERVIERHVEVGPSSDPLWLALGVSGRDVHVALAADPGTAALESRTLPPSPARSSSEAAESTAPLPMHLVRVPARQQPVQFSVALAASRSPRIVRRPLPSAAAPVRWPQEVTSKIARSTKTGAYVVDGVGLPLDNPWRRLVRPGDVQFLADGTAFVVTLDGDVWRARGLHEPGDRVRWRRFASGLHEPLTMAVRDGQLYVFDRNGIWCLRDTNGDGEADVHELFSNAFAQTADMREFPNTIRLGPGGEFVIAKGGQEAATIGKHNGSVLRIAADGRRATVLGYGLRQPNLSVNPRTGLVLASDQQGHYVPSTPLHVIRDRQFYGFISTSLPHGAYPAPIADPLTWIPHAINASAMSQVWLLDARMGPLDGGLVHIGFNRPELFRVLLNERGSRLQAAVVGITHDFDFPLLNGSVNPVDGQLYVAGFQILGWGTTATRLAGMGRVRYTGAPSVVPREAVAFDQGVLLRFDVELDAARAADPARYTIGTWHYRRSHNYGSPQLRADGTPGIDRVPLGRVYLSADRKSVFVAVPNMAPVMQMQVAWSLATAAGLEFRSAAALTPYELPRFDPAAEGFGAVTIDRTPVTAATELAETISAAEGKRVYERSGCMACHANQRAAAERLGPTLAGVFGSLRPLADGRSSVRADDSYLRESLLEPAAKIVAGFDKNGVGMPSYAGVLSDAQIESVLLYIRSLK